MTKPLPLKKSSFCLRSTRIATPEGMLNGAVCIADGKIDAVLSENEIAFNTKTSPDFIDCGNLLILPGVIDGHVHVNQPGRTDWEGMESASRAAAASGITMLVDMPLNSSPVTISKEKLGEKIDSVSGQCWVDVGFHGGVIGPESGAATSKSSPEIVRGLIEAGVVGIKVFQCDSGLAEFPSVTHTELEWLMPILAEYGLPLWSHAELIPSEWNSPDRIDHYSEWPEARSKDFECRAIDELIEFCDRYRCPVHIVHLASAEALNAIRRAKRRGLPLTIETCPHYLYFATENIPPRDPRFKCCPPIRDLQNRHRLWEALEMQEIDTIGSDHSPCPPAMKFLNEGDFAKAWGGIASLQLLLPIMWDTAQKYQLPISRLVECMSSSPAKLLGVDHERGSITPGKRADLVVFDPDATWTVVGEDLQHRHKITPYEGIEIQGQVIQTYLSGKKIFDRGSFLGRPSGEIVRRPTAIPPSLPKMGR
jgi:allantoinase